MRRATIAYCQILGVLALLTSATGSAGADTLINYSALGSFQGPLLDTGGVTVTGSNTLNVFNPVLGLGILGGIPDFIYRDGTVDSTESMTFRFDAGPAVGIAVNYSFMGNTPPSDAMPATQTTLPAAGETLVQAFDSAGQPLGTVDLIPSAFRLDISGAFDQPLSSFTLQPVGNPSGGAFFVVTGLDYTSVPEPATLMAWTVVLLALFGASLKRPFRFGNGTRPNRVPGLQPAKRTIDADPRGASIVDLTP